MEVKYREWGCQHRFSNSASTFYSTLITNIWIIRINVQIDCTHDELNENPKSNTYTNQSHARVNQLLRVKNNKNK